MIPRIQVLLALLGALALIPATLAQGNSSSSAASSTRYITYQSPDGSTVYLEDNRKPALYTQNFGDCLGSSLINVTRFDAAYYQDNMTVLFHLAGTSSLMNQSVMMYIGVFAYGESRFDLTFNPCLANIYSLCPLNSSNPIAANGIIPISDSDVANIPDIALSIPDFEGQAILRIFDNRTQSEIGCYSAVVTNGASFSQPSSVGTVLGIFTLVALIGSFATAAYGEAVPTMRLHYAHSVSVGVVFAVFQHIFFTGAISMNWPSVLVAWWSNFAWAGGMIYTTSMQNTINGLIGNDVGNTSSVGAAPVGSTQETLGGGYDISQIYGRSLNAARSALSYPANHPLARDIASEIYKGDDSIILRRSIVQKSVQHALSRRDELANSSTGYNWYGSPVGVGLPLPGNYSGFAGTLAEEGLAISNAFMTGFLWFLIALFVLTGTVVAFKWILEGLIRIKFVKNDRLAFFRAHWIRYSAAIALRTFFVSFFMMMFLTIFQFTYHSPASVKAIAAIVFIIFLVGVVGIATYACLYKGRLDGSRSNMPNYYLHERRRLLSSLPFLGNKKNVPSAQAEQAQDEPVSEEKGNKGSFWKRNGSRNAADGDAANQYSVHDDEDYILKFGWLVSRFRRTKWWFFTFWIFYEFVRACFYGAASGNPLAQIFCLLVIEILAFAFVIWAKPFEGRRLNLLVVYCLGFSKVTSLGLSVAFDVQFNLQRITTTVIGVVIIVIQGILTIITMIAIVVGAASSYASVCRNVEDFRPRRGYNLRERYFDHLDRVVNELPPEPKVKKVKKPPTPPPEPELPKEPYFEMKNVRRLAKIEDEDEIFTDEVTTVPEATASRISLDQRPRSNSRQGSGALAGIASANRSRGTSISSLPYGARPHRPSWSTRDFDSWNRDEGPYAPSPADMTREHTYSPVDMTQEVPDDDDSTALPPKPRAAHTRTSSLGSKRLSKIRPQASNESMRVAGDVSTRDVIGKVPAPSMKPRVGSFNFDLGDEQYDSQPNSRRQTRHPMLTPAQETEEFPSFEQPEASNR